jgi:hypothetical protein
MGRQFSALAMLCLVLVVPARANDGKVESIGAFEDAAAPAAVKSVLDAAGYRVSLDDGSVWCEIWLRKNTPTRPKADVQGAIYTELPESVMIGLLKFPKQANDFRGQMIKAGTYTLRYSLHPVDGNHIGISQYRDFLVMVPLEADPNPDAQFKFEDLSKLSGRAAGTNHPAPLDADCFHRERDRTTIERWRSA